MTTKLMKLKYIEEHSREKTNGKKFKLNISMHVNNNFHPLQNAITIGMQ